MSHNKDANDWLKIAELQYRKSGEGSSVEQTAMLQAAQVTVLIALCHAVLDVSDSIMRTGDRP